MTPSGSSSHKKTKSNAVAPYQVHEFTGYDMSDKRRESGITQLTHGGVQEVDPNRTESLMPPVGKDSHFIRSSSGGHDADDGALVDLKGNSSAGTSNEHIHETRGRAARGMVRSLGIIPNELYPPELSKQQLIRVRTFFLKQPIDR